MTADSRVRSRPTAIERMLNVNRPKPMLLLDRFFLGVDWLMDGILLVVCVGLIAHNWLPLFYKTGVDLAGLAVMPYCLGWLCGQARTRKAIRDEYLVIYESRTPQAIEGPADVADWDDRPAIEGETA